MEWHRVCVVSIEYVSEPAISVYLLALCYRMDNTVPGSHKLCQ